MLTELINNDKVLGIYKYGSQVYGTLTDKSDLDYVVIVDNNYDIIEDTIRYIDPKNGKHYDFNLYKSDKWQEMCDNCHITAIEIRSLIGTEYEIKNIKDFNYVFDVIKIRQSISAVVSNAWAKAHKKLIVDKDYSPYIAKKSLWHCFRILMFGIQTYRYGGIVDFNEANSIYDEIVNNECNDWNVYKNKYQESLNKLRTEFRKYSEKEWIEFKKIKYGND